MPILFVRGDASPAASQIGLDAHEMCLPPHETAIIENAAHNVYIDNSEAFNRAVLEFVRDH